MGQAAREKMDKMTFWVGTPRTDRGGGSGEGGQDKAWQVICLSLIHI